MFSPRRQRSKGTKTNAEEEEEEGGEDLSTAVARLTSIRCAVQGGAHIRIHDSQVATRQSLDPRLSRTSVELSGQIPPYSKYPNV